MKNLLNFKFIAMMLACCFTLTFAACDDDNKKDDPVNVDKTEIEALLTECADLLANATTADYPQEAIDEFTTKVAAITTALTSAKTQTVVDNLLTQLKEAKKAFEAAAFGAIPEEAKLLEWTFDEGEGTALTSTGVQKWVANFSTATELFTQYGGTAEMPTFAEGKSGKAIHLKNGAFLQVTDFNSSLLLGDKLSVSVWAKPDVTKAGNYIVSMGDWHNWKFQVQDNGKPFFTVATNEGIVDADNEGDLSCPENTWTHLVVSMDLPAGTLSFYVNGELTKTWDKSGKPALGTAQVEAAKSDVTGEAYPFMIGAACPVADVLSWATGISSWNGFDGSLDELKIYNIALSEGQAKKLYNDEK